MDEARKCEEATADCPDANVLTKLQGLLCAVQESARVKPSRARALAITHLEEAIMWLEKAA